MDSPLLLYAPSPNDADSFAPLAQFLEAMVLPIAYRDAQHRYCYVNDAFAARFRFPKSHCIGADADDARCPEILQLSTASKERVLSGHFLRQERADQSRPDAANWWIVEYYPNRNMQGAVVGYFVIAREITVQKELERAVGERGEQVRKLVESIALPMARWNREAELVYCNTPYERWVGRSRHDIIGKTLAELFGPSAWAVSKSSFERAFSGVSTSYERQVHRQNGSPRWHRVLVFPDQTGIESELNVYTIAFDIDDDIRLRQQLAANEARLRSLLESIDVPIARFTPDYSVAYCNRPYVEFLGKTNEEIVGRSIETLLGQDVFAFVKPFYERAFTGETVVFDREMNHLSPPRWMRIRLLPDRDATGLARAVVCSVYDVDTDVRARSELEESRKRLDEFANSIPFPLTYLDRDETYRFANKAFLQRHRLTIDQVVGQHPRAARGEQIWSRIKPFFNDALSGKASVYERPVVLASGESRWTRTVYSSDVADDGTIRGVYGASFDIHELKVAQDEIARVDAQLSAHISRGPVAVVEYDRLGRIVQWSRRAEALLGYTREWMIGREITLNQVHPDDRAELQTVIERILSGNEEIVTNTHRYRHRDGRHIWIEWYTSIIRDAAGNAQSIMSLGVDRTERLEARMRLQRLADRIPNPITYVGTDLKYEFVNASFTEWTGIAAEKMIGKTPREARGAALGSMFESLIKRALEGKEVSMERKATLADGRVRWIRNVFSPDFGDDGKIVGCYNVSFDVHDIKLNEEALRRDADSDALTSALSRRAFFVELDRMLAACDGAAISLLFIDLDGFKTINDEYGHASGDKLLTAAVRAMRDAMQAQDVVGRLGGDEFVVITRIASRSAVMTLTRRVIDAIERVPGSLGLQKKLSASIGIAQTISRAGASNSDELVRLADRAMYRAKREGGAQCFFSD
jgi:diguanylate cyclase (GGDEF)-like protein/PAS domain S-box-containing protein